MTTASQATGLAALAERIELWPIDRLRAYERNPRTHSEAQVDQIAASMVEFGCTNPIWSTRTQASSLVTAGSSQPASWGSLRCR